MHGRHCHVLREDPHGRPAGEIHPVHVPFSRNYSLIEYDLSVCYSLVKIYTANVGRTTNSISEISTKM